jgi:hypothetical protein
LKKLTISILLTGPDVESVPLQVLVYGRNMFRGLHPNGSCRGGNEQRKGNLAAEMEHEPAHNRVLGKLIKYTFISFLSKCFIFLLYINSAYHTHTGHTEHCCKIRDDFMGCHAARPNLPVDVLRSICLIHHCP